MLKPAAAAALNALLDKQEALTTDGETNTAVFFLDGDLLLVKNVDDGEGPYVKWLLLEQRIATAQDLARIADGTFGW